MSFRLLIDECLSPELVDLAVEAGYVESTCVRDRGLLAGLGTDDLRRQRRLHAVVTHNARDFRGTGATDPG